MTQPVSVTVDDLRAGLERVGLRPARTVLVHSALRPFGHVDGGQRGDR